MKTFDNRRLRFIISRCFVVGILCLGLSSAHATVYLENLDRVVDNTAPINATTWGGQSFVTDNSALGFTLNAITFSLGNAPFVPPPPSLAGGGNFSVHLLPPPGGFEVFLYANGGNNTPGTLLECLTGNINPDVPGNYTYSSSGYLLLPNTVYWAIATVQSSSVSEYYLNYTASTAFNGTWSTLGWTYTEDSGANWWAADLTEPDMISVDATAVPEPAAYAGVLSAVALAMAGMRFRKKRRSSS